MPPRSAFVLAVVFATTPVAFAAVRWGDWLDAVLKKVHPKCLRRIGKETR